MTILVGFSGWSYDDWVDDSIHGVGLIKSMWKYKTSKNIYNGRKEVRI